MLDVVKNLRLAAEGWDESPDVVWDNLKHLYGVRGLDDAAAAGRIAAIVEREVTVMEAERATLIDYIQADGTRYWLDADGNSHFDHSGGSMIELPRDADGEYIHFGDVLDQFGTPMTVFAMSDPNPDEGDCMLQLIDCDTGADSVWVRARKMRHHKPPTVEDVIDEIADKAASITASYLENGMNRDEHMATMRELAKEFAPKLRLAGGEDA